MIDPRNKQFFTRLEKALKEKRKGAERGVRLTLAYIKTESQKRVPVDEGNLKASADTDVYKSGKAVGGEVGFTAKYAAAVHEMPMVNEGTARADKIVDGVRIPGKGDYWDPQGTATNKFMEKAIDENKDNLLRILQKSIG